MAATPLTAVRLTEIPFSQRMSAARIAAKDCHTPKEALEVLAAAIGPSEKVYWIRTEAVDLARAAA